MNNNLYEDFINKIRNDLVHETENNFWNLETPSSKDDVYDKLDDINSELNELWELSKTTRQDIITLKWISKDLENKQQNNITLIIWVLFVGAIAIIWRLSESIFRSYTETIELRTDVLELRLKNEELKNDVEDAKKDNELLIEKQYNEFLKIQLNKK